MPFHISLLCRCGMVYIDPAELSWEPYVKTWMKKKFGTARQESQVASLDFHTMVLHCLRITSLLLALNLASLLRCSLLVPCKYVCYVSGRVLFSQDYIWKLFETYVARGLKFITKKCTQVMQQVSEDQTWDMLLQNMKTPLQCFGIHLS